MVAIPLRLLDRRLDRSPTFSRTSLYSGPALRWKKNAPQMISGIGVKASRAISGESTKNTAPTATTVTPTWISELAPPSRKRSSWLTSSFMVATSWPELFDSKKPMSSRWACS